MSDRKFIIPEYGPFAGMRVITSEVGAQAVRDKGHEAIVVDMTSMNVCR